MRHVGNGQDWSAILSALDALATAASRQSNSGSPSTLRNGESWVERIAKEKWTAQKGFAIASAVVGVGAIIYGAKRIFAHEKSSGLER